jgi:hypothetical protein
MTVKGRVGATQFLEFIKRLLQGTEKVIFLIVDVSRHIRLRWSPDLLNLNL